MNFILFFMYQLVHFLGDYVLVTPYMLKAKSSYKKLGILQHSLVHLGLIVVFSLVYAVLSNSELSLKLSYVCVFYFATHFMIDCLKSYIEYNYPVYSIRTHPYYWYLFGLDQLSHQLVIYVCIQNAFN